MKNVWAFYIFELSLQMEEYLLAEVEGYELIFQWFLAVMIGTNVKSTWEITIDLKKKKKKLYLWYARFWNILERSDDNEFPCFNERIKEGMQFFC